METSILFEVSGMWSDPFGFSYEVLLAAVSDEVCNIKLHPKNCTFRHGTI
jgi:hypothetical protein